MTVDVTGLQTFPEFYKNGVPLGTQAQWGWHSFLNVNNYKHEETLKTYDYGWGRIEPYSVQDKNGDERHKGAVEYFRVNPHRLHLGIIGLELNDNIQPSDIKEINQRLDMWNGIIHSSFTLNSQNVKVETVCHPTVDMVSAKITSEMTPAVKFHFPYPTLTIN